MVFDSTNQSLTIVTLITVRVNGLVGENAQLDFQTADQDVLWRGSTLRPLIRPQTAFVKLFSLNLEVSVGGHPSPYLNSKSVNVS